MIAEMNILMEATEGKIEATALKVEFKNKYMSCWTIRKTIRVSASKSII